jgi:uncharacterized protein (TIGR03437 family)
VLAVFVPRYLTGQTSVTYPVGTQPAGIVFDGTNIWVANQLSYTVTKLLAASGAIVGTYPIGGPPSSPAFDGGFPSALAFDGTNIWVPSGNQMTKLLAATGATVGIYPLPQYAGNGVVFDGTNIWVADGNGVTKLLASTGAILGTYNLGAGSGPGALVFDGTNIWVANANGVTVLLASTGKVLGTYASEPGAEATALAFDGTNIWVAKPSGALCSSAESPPPCNNGMLPPTILGTVTKLVAATGSTVGIYPVRDPNGIAFDGTKILVTSYGLNTVTRLLASTGAIVDTYPVGSGPSGIVYDGANIWVTNSGDNTVTKTNPANLPQITPGGVAPVYSTVNTIEPGEWVSIYGTNLASSTLTWNGNFPTSLGGTSVMIDGEAAYLSYVSPGLINLQAPDDTNLGSVAVVVTTPNGSADSTVMLAQFAPSFSLLDNKHVAGIILRSNGSGAYGGGGYDIIGPTGNSLGYPTVAAKAGDTVELFGVGFGPTTPSVHAGQAFSGAAATTNTVHLAINGTTVLPFFAGLSEAGLYQINVTIPVGLGTGDLSLVATVGGVQTQPGVVISLQ